MLSLLSRWFPFVRKKKRKEVWPFPIDAQPGFAATISSELRQNLRLKCGFDEGKIDRLIEHERSLNPQASIDTLMAAAIERWERENR
ncbi:MAG: hypothetical protein ABJF23_09325 [Bryobacteraceae bacterium]